MQDPWCTINFTFAGTKQLERSLKNLGTSLENFTRAYERIADDYYDTMKRVFESEGGEIEHPWKPLTESTQKAKDSEFPGRGILERTGELKASLTDKSAPNAVCEISPSGLVIGSNVRTKSGIPLMRLHQYGWNKPEIIPRTSSALSWGSGDSTVFAKKSKAVHVEARPVFIATEEIKERWIRIIQEETTTKINEAVGNI